MPPGTTSASFRAHAALLAGTHRRGPSALASCHARAVESVRDKDLRELWRETR